VSATLLNNYIREQIYILHASNVEEEHCNLKKNNDNIKLSPVIPLSFRVILKAKAEI
jgi:hypothetical protein